MKSRRGSTSSRPEGRGIRDPLHSRCNEKARSGAPVKIDGTIEAQVTLLACSDPPEGRSSWTLRLIADKLVEMEVVDSISAMSIQRILKKVKPSHGRRFDGV